MSLQPVKRGLSPILGVALLVGLAMVVLAPTAASSGSCGGETPTILGTRGDDVLVGTSGPDVIDGRGGDDHIDGKGGNDVICGSTGDDVIAGGDGADLLVGGSGSDLVRGGDGNDRIEGGSDTDTLLGMGGDDTLDGGTGDDTLDGGPGDDRIAGGNGNDHLAGGTGNDLLDGGEGNDRLLGDAGADDLEGGEGTDGLLGGRGSDHLAGGPGADTLSGGSDSDVLHGDGGADTLLGGGGTDRLEGGGDPDRLNGGPGADVLEGDDGDDLLEGGAGPDVCAGGGGIDKAVGCERADATEIGNRPPIRTSPSSHAVALTFDDGPNPVYTPIVLDILARNHVRATFFVTGYNAKRYPHLIQRMIDEGHSVQNHTCGHAWLTRYSNSGAAAEIECLNKIIEGIARIRPRCVRPPFGATSPRIESIIAGLGMKTVMWDVDPWDFKRPGSSVTAGKVLSAARGGDVILLHDTAGYSTYNALSTIISGLRDRNLTFETICG